MENITAMEKLTAQEIALLGTMLAIEITKNKTVAEMKCIKHILGQMFATVNTLLCKC